MTSTKGERERVGGKKIFQTQRNKKLCAEILQIYFWSEMVGNGQKWSEMVRIGGCSQPPKCAAADYL